ncbi:MAG: DNA polymerase III subunit beta [Actinomycetota bacterium]
MKFTVATEDLAKAIKNVQPAVAKRPICPVLGGIRVEASESRLHLQATDLDLTINAQVDARVEDIGVAVISAKQLTTVAKAIKNPDLTIASGDQDRVHITDGRVNLTLATLPSQDWPNRRSSGHLTSVATVTGDELVRAISRVVRCASGDQGRPVLTGVQFNLDAGSRTAELVATDSYRLGVAAVRMQSVNPDYTERPILAAGPLKAMAAKIPGASEVSIYAGCPEGQPCPVVEFRFAATTWRLRAIEGEFPNWRRIVPDGNAGGSFEFDAKELGAAVSDAAGIRTDRSTPVRLNLGPSCSIRMIDGTVGELSQPLTQAVYSPNGTGPMEIAFNPAFLKDAISFLDADRAILRVTDPCKPALFVGVDERCVLMPVRTN